MKKSSTFFFWTVLLLSSCGPQCENITLSDGQIHVFLIDYDMEFDSPKAELFFYEAMELWGDGQTERALDSFNKAILVEPDNEAIYLEKANIYAIMSNHSNAVAHYDAALDRNPEFAIAYANRGSEKQRLRMYNETIEDFEQAALFGMTHYTLHLAMAKAYMSKLEFCSAKIIFNKAANLAEGDECAEDFSEIMAYNEIRCNGQSKWNDSLILVP